MIDHRATADMIGLRVLTVPVVSDELATRVGSKMVTSLCALGETEAADAALTHQLLHFLELFPGVLR